MKFRIHYTYKDYEDAFIVEGDELEICKEKADNYFKSRGLNPDDCNPWSEEII